MPCLLRLLHRCLPLLNGVGHFTCVLLLLLQPVRAQYFEDIKEDALPQKPESSEPISHEAETPDLPGDGDQVLVPELKAMVFFNRTEEVESVETNGLSYFDGVAVVDVELIDNATFRKRVEYHLGRPVTLNAINEIARTANRYMASIGRPVVRVVVPPQDITSGVIQFGVIEGRLKAVSVSGAKYFKPERIASQIRLERGGPIDFAELQKDINWLNRNAFRTVSPVVRKGEGFGGTDLELIVEDRLPLFLYANVNNSGSRSTDLLRYTLGGQAGNLWRRNHQAQFSFTTNGQTREYRSYSGGYTVPLPWRHELQFVGGYSRTISNSPSNPVKGTSWQLSTRYNIPDGKWLGWQRSMSLGAQLSSSDSEFFFAGAAIPLGINEAAQGDFQINLNRRDRYWDGATSLSLRMVGGKGSLEDVSPAAIPLDSYFYTTFFAQRRWALNNGWSMFTEFDMQYATDPLPTLESYGLGGRDTIRGFDNRIISGDSGWRVRAELRTPAIRGLSRLKWMQRGDALQARTFYDYGTAMNVVTLSGGGITDDTPLGAAGFGMTYNIRDRLSLDFDYGWQILRLEDFTDRNQRGHFQLRLTY